MSTAIQFPSSPSDAQQYEHAGHVWVYDAAVPAWKPKSVGSSFIKTSDEGFSVTLKDTVKTIDANDYLTVADLADILATLMKTLKDKRII